MKKKSNLLDFYYMQIFVCLDYINILRLHCIISVLKIKVLIIHLKKKKKKLYVFHGGSENIESTWNAGDPGSIPESGKSPGDSSGNPP